MIVIGHWNEVPEDYRGAVIAIGNFDGAHKGHQVLFEQGEAIARAEGRPFGVLTFEPHPRKLFRPDDPPFRITPRPLKKRRLEECGIELMVELAFDWDFASQSPQEFVHNVLDNGLQPGHIIVGYDFCFGQLRQGTPETLREAGYAVTVIDKVADEGHDVVSCSTIRQALQDGHLEDANQLLGWDWEMEGVVQMGEQRGRTLGYPTANVPLGETLHPAYGVYACWVQIVDDGPDAPWLPSATNIGIRPMFEIPVGQIESFIFDFDRNIYGKRLRVRPVRRLRTEAKLESLDALIRQMELDCRQARAILGV